MTTTENPMTTTDMLTDDAPATVEETAEEATPPGDGPGTPPLPPELLDELLAAAGGDDGFALTGPDGLVGQITKQVLERAMAVELADHLGYDHSDPAGRGSGNSRNGTTPKTIRTEVGEVDLDVPRDRNGTFEPVIVPKHARRFDGFNAQIISLYAGGMTNRDIARHLRKIYGTDVSAQLISDVTDGIVDELNEWQNRPLDAVYPILYIDALVVKVRDAGKVVNKACYVAIGVDVEGRKHVLGLWLGEGGEGAKFWLAVLTEIHNRGVTDVVFVCCDGLTGLPDAIEATWPHAIVQTCVIHLMRASFRYCTYKDRKAVSAALRPIYTAPTADAAADALDDFELTWGDRYPAVVRLWRDAWEQFSPFLAYPPELRKVIYTTNLIESVNYQLRKVSKNRGHFPNDAAALKLLRLVARDITTTRGGTAGTGTWGWKQVLNILDIHFPNRLHI